MSVPKIGCMIWDGNYSVQHDTDYRYGKRLKYFSYNWQKPEDEKIVVFSDYAIPSLANPRFNNVEHKIAWMMEGPGIYATWGGFLEVKKWLLSNLDKVSAVATCDDSLVASYPDKMIFVPFGGIIVSEADTKIYNKTKLCSLTSGNLTGMRATIYSKYKDTSIIDFLGKSFQNPYNSTVDGFRDYMYHLSICSCKNNRYFSSNLTDALACGTIPIWWGCSKLDDFFDMNGILTFDTLEELKVIISKIGIEDYNSRMVAIESNFKLVENYRTPENALWENVLIKFV